MTWIIIVLVAWPLVGLGVAYLFGRFTRQGDAYADATELAAPPVVSYLRRSKRGKASSRTVASVKPRHARSGGPRVN